MAIIIKSTGRKEKVHMKIKFENFFKKFWKLVNYIDFVYFCKNNLKNKIF